MEQVRAFVTLIAPWLAAPGDRPLSRAVLVVVILLLAFGVGSTGWVAVEAVHYVVSRVTREDVR